MTTATAPAAIPVAPLAPGSGLRVTQVRVLRSEWVKFRSLRSTLWTMGLSVVLMIGLGAMFSAISVSSAEGMDPGNTAISTSLTGTFFAQLAVGVLGALLITQLLIIPAYYWLSRRTSKKTGFITAVSLWMAVMVYSFFITPESGRASVFVFGCAMGLATGGVVVMIYSIFPDLPDVDELVTGMRREGVYAGLLTFMRKLSSALAIFLISQAIALAGYVPPVSETIDGVTKLVQQPQSPEFLVVLRAVFAAVPILLLVCCLYFALRFPLTPRLHARLKEFLARRRSGETGADLDAEEKYLKDALV